MDTTPGNFDMQVELDGVAVVRERLDIVDSQIGPWLAELSNDVMRGLHVRYLSKEPKVTALTVSVPMDRLGDLRAPADAVVGVRADRDLAPRRVWDAGAKKYKMEVPKKKDGGSDPGHWPVFRELGHGVIRPRAGGSGWLAFDDNRGTASAGGGYRDFGLQERANRVIVRSVRAQPGTHAALRTQQDARLWIPGVIQAAKPRLLAD